MKKIEIQNLITRYLSNNPVRFIDLVGTVISINSYEKYITLFSAMRKTFAESIPEFRDVASRRLEVMSQLLETCDTKEDTDITSYISNNTKSSLGFTSYYSSDMNLKSVFQISMTKGNEYSEKSLKLIYQEYGYESLLSYIELLKNPSQLSSYLNNSSKQVIAFHFILFKTNHHSTTKFSRDMTVKKLYDTMNNNLTAYQDEISVQKDEYIHFMNEEREGYRTWFEESDTKFNELYDSKASGFDNFMTDSKEKIRHLEQTYADKLRLEDPSDYMFKKSKEYKESARNWAIVTVVLAALLLILLGVIIDPQITFSDKVISIQLFSNEMPIYSSIVLLAMIVLIIYVLKIFIKIVLSSKHLSEEYYQKHVLTYFYLSLLNENKMDSQQANIILSTLFTKADTGLIKNDSNVELESIMKIIMSNKS